MPITAGTVLLIDLWATEPNGVYADQTWMASLGTPSDRTHVDLDGGARRA